MIEEIYTKATKAIENIPKIYENGKSAGYSKGYREGEQAQYDLFWDTIQAKGTRTNYAYAFAGWYYAAAVLKPKYDIKPVGSVEGMFRNGLTHVSLPTICKQQGIVMDFSKTTNFNVFLRDSAIYHIGIVDCSSATGLTNAFHSAYSLVTIDELILHEGITAYTDTFAYCSNLKDMKVTGTIAANGINVNWCPNLTHDSLMSIINALKDYSGTTTTKTITFGATNLAKLSDTEKAIATQKGWTLA